MRKKLFLLSLSLVGVAAAATPGMAFSGKECPGNIVVGGNMACHNTGGTDCRSCTYVCDDGSTNQWNVCDVAPGGE